MDKEFIVTQIINAVIIILTTFITLQVARPKTLKEQQRSATKREYLILVIALIAAALIIWRIFQLSAGANIPLIAGYSALLVAYGLFLIARVGRFLH